MSRNGASAAPEQDARWMSREGAIDMAINKIAFTKTPQAKDDYYSWLEDELIASNYYDATTRYLTLDVMSNDLGGAAKSLYSIDDGAGNPLNPTDLLSADGLVNGISAWQLTASGNYARINNGKIEVDLSPELGAAGVDGLGAGDHFTDTFVYAIRLGNGTLSWAHVHIDILGANDSASISGDDSGDVKEDVVLSISGQLVVSDVDIGEAELVPVAAGTAGDNGYGAFEVLADGTWTYTLDNAHGAVQALPEGATLTDTITVWSEDGTDSQVITVTIGGTSDLPVLPPVFTGGGDANDNDALIGSATAGFTLVIGDDNANSLDFNGNTNEIINAFGGNDTITSGNGTDRVYAGLGDDNVNGEAGIDLIYGQGGADTLSGDSSGDSIYGGSGGDSIVGNAGDDVIFGGSGADTIDGGSNNDEIAGGFGADTLTGGDGADDFNFTHVNDTGDVIVAFAQGVDDIDLTALFGGTLGSAGNTTTVAANSVNWFQSGADTIITVDIDGDATADLAITLANFTASTLTAGDFFL
jgi:VCBS repeat-containing protein